MVSRSPAGGLLARWLKLKCQVVVANWTSRISKLIVIRLSPVASVVKILKSESVMSGSSINIVRAAGLLLQGCLAASALAVDTIAKTANSDAYSEVTANVDAETAARGGVVWGAMCARCHEQNVARAPQRFILEQLMPESILEAMRTGPMKEVARDIAHEDRIAIAEYVTKRKIEPIDAMDSGVMCQEDALIFDRAAPPSLANWGFDSGSTHYIGADTASLTAEQLSDMTLDWAFAYPAATRARSQPAIAGGALYVGSHSGIVYAMDLESGCVRWKFQASSEVRNAIVVEPWASGDTSANPKVFFGDITGHQYALEAFSGKLLWSKMMDDHPAVTLTAASALLEDTLYVALSSLEEGSAISPSYPCCTFRGAIVALDPESGDEKWRRYFIEPSTERGKNGVGVPSFGPAGVPVWAGLAFDGDVMLVATGDDYAEPASLRSDAVIAVNRHTGEIIWVHQTRHGDVWNGSCEELEKPNCPEESGPDWDYGAGPVVATTKAGRKIVVAGDKGSVVVGIDLATGENLWQNKVGRGGVVAGINFGIATHNGVVYVPVSDVPDGRSYDTPANPGVFALDAQTGEFIWKAPSKEDMCHGRPGCYPGYSAAITVTDEFVLAGSNDGYLRAFDTKTGDLLWQFDTTQAFTTVDGATAQGGAIGGGQAPLVIGDRIIVNSGYAFAGKMPGNALLVLKPRVRSR